MAEARWGKQWNQHGIFQPTKKDKAFDREELQKHLQALDLDNDMARPLDAGEAQILLGVEQSGVWLPRGASLSLAKAANDLLQKHKRLTCFWSTHINRLEACNGGWLLFDGAGQPIMSAHKVIVAAAMEAKTLMASVDIRLPLKPVRGQLSIFSIAKNDPWAAQLPRVGISGDGYCLPAEELADGSRRWIVGSSFDEGEDDLEARESSDMFNREQAQGLLDYREGDSTSLKVADCFVGIRCVAGDRLPIIGALTQRPGIFLATALGSRGVLWSALAAKLITAQVLEDDFALLARLGLATQYYP